MSCYKCDFCEEIRDADFHGCNENPKDECGCICDSCEETLIEQGVK